MKLRDHLSEFRHEQCDSDAVFPFFLGSDSYSRLTIGDCVTAAALPWGCDQLSGAIISSTILRSSARPSTGDEFRLFARRSAWVRVWIYGQSGAQAIGMFFIKHA
jgi:hypothetical protein